MRILLVDYMGSIHAHYHWEDKDPRYAFLIGLRNIIHQFKVDKTFILLEGGKSRYRLAKYPEYKAQRETSRAKWTEAQLDKYKKFKSDANTFAKEVLPMFGCTPLRVWGCEADDLAGYMVNHMDYPEHQVMLLSADQDWHMLLRPGVVQGSYPVIIKAGFPCPANLWLSVTGFQEKYGIGVHNWIWKKCLSGDNGDNVKGFNKVGEVTALNLIKRYGDIESIKLNLDCLDIPRMSQAAKDHMKEDFDLIYRNYDIMNLNFSNEEELEVFGQEGIDYLSDAIADYNIYDKRLDLPSITELGYENGWIELLESEFLAAFKKQIIVYK